MVRINNKPMMSDKEIQIIDELIEDLKPQHCLEWGAGASTIYFPQKHRCIKTWLAAEENGNYVKHLAPQVKNNTTIIWLPKDQWYHDAVKHSRLYDFILIDGYNREGCLEVARRVISDDGIILLHDAGRGEYQAMIKEHEGEILSEGEIEAADGYAHRGLALFRKHKTLIGQVYGA